MSKIRFRKPKTKHEKYVVLHPGQPDLRPDHYLHSHARKARSNEMPNTVIS